MGDLIGLHKTLYLTRKDADEIINYAKARSVILLAGIEDPTPGDLCIGLILSALREVYPLAAETR